MSSFCSASKLCPSLSWKPIWINRKYMYVFHSELYSSKDAETKPYAGPAMRFSGWEEHLAKLGSPLISAWCQELCLVWLRQKEGKDVMQGVYNMERFPESPAYMACILQRCCHYPSFKSNLPHNENLILLSCKFPEKALSDYYKVFFSHQPMFLFIFSKYNKGISVFSVFQYKKNFHEEGKKLLFFLSNLGDLLN